MHENQKQNCSFYSIPGLPNANFIESFNEFIIGFFMLAVRNPKLTSTNGYCKYFFYYFIAWEIKNKNFS
jgi:hypothetical protein